jgi:hypothetical protein
MRNLEFSSNLVLSQYSMVHEASAGFSGGRMCILLTSASDQNAQARPSESPQDARALHFAQLDIMDHFPTNWGRPVSLKPPIPLYVETKNVFIEI